MERDYLRERTRHGTSDFPVAMYRMKFDRQYDLLAPLHYHKEFELVMVTEGMVTVQIEKDPYTFHRGEGAFVNSGQLHVIRAADGGRHGFIAVVFDPALLCEKPDRIPDDEKFQKDGQIGSAGQERADQGGHRLHQGQLFPAGIASESGGSGEYKQGIPVPDLQ